MYGKASIDKKSGRLIEFQSGDPNADTMMQNAINMGYTKGDIDIVEMTEKKLKEINPSLFER